MNELPEIGQGVLARPWPRREFLAAAGAAGLGLVAGCGPSATGAPSGSGAALAAGGSGAEVLDGFRGQMLLYHEHSIPRLYGKGQATQHLVSVGALGIFLKLLP